MLVHARSIRIQSMVICMLLAMPALAQNAGRTTGRRIVVEASQTVSLPYMTNDAGGTRWMIYDNGWFQQQGDMPLYHQSGMLTIAGNTPQMRQGSARLLTATEELILERMTAGQVVVTRRIRVNKEQNLIRYIDIIENAGPREVTVPVQVQSMFMTQMPRGTTIADPKDKQVKLAWIGTSDQGRVAFVLAGTPGAEVTPTIEWNENNRRVAINARLTIPAGEQRAIVHVYGMASGEPEAQEWLNDAQPRNLLADVPKDIRELIVNVPLHRNIIAGQELVRGELFDVVELRDGGQVHGTLTDQTFQINTLAGTFTVPAERLLGILNVGALRPRQLVVLKDGQILGGELAKQTIGMTLSTGQATEVPLSRIAQVGTRRASDEPDEIVLAQPHVVLTSGDRLFVQLPPQPIEMMTRYGMLRVEPSQVAAVVFRSEAHGVHELHLTDGSQIAGLLATDQLALVPAELPDGRPVTFAVGMLDRLLFVPELPARDPLAPVLTTISGDRLIGALSGELSLETSFDTLTIPAREVRGIERSIENPGEVTVTLFDQSALDAMPRQDVVTCALRSGMTMTLPTSAVQSYRQPQPQPPSGVVEQVRELVLQLNADDWRQRELAEERLTSMGDMVVAVLREMRDEQPLEARQRIDKILEKFQPEEETGGSGNVSGPVPVAPDVLPRMR